MIHDELLAIFARLERALPGHVRHRVHHRAGQALDAPDPRRQAHRRRRAAHGRRDDEGHRQGHGASWKITKEEALTRVTAEHLDSVLHPQFAGTGDVIAKGLAASPGAAVGKVYFTADDAEAAAERGEKVILVRSETSPEDVHGMMVAEGILTARGGLVSHAAVVARGWGTPAVVGAESVKIDGKPVHRRTTSPSTRATASRSTARPARSCSAQMALRPAEPPPEFDIDPRRGPTRSARASSRVRANADTGEDADQRPRARRRGHRPVPHRAHVPRPRPPAGRARR